MPDVDETASAGRPARLSREVVIAAIAIAAILLHLLLRFGVAIEGAFLGFPWRDVPLIAALAIGGVPLVAGLAGRLLRREFSSDLLAGMSIITAVILGEYLAAVLVVLMLSGGEALEAYAVRSASSALKALASRMPSLAHRKRDGALDDVPVDQVAVGDVLVVFPHETCPVDGVVLEGRSTMDESYLTGEPYMLSKVVGSTVMSGAVNGNGALTIRAEKAAVDSRYARIMHVMRDSEQRRPRLRRLGDQLGAWYTPLALGLAIGAWVWSGDPVRFLAVLVVAREHRHDVIPGIRAPRPGQGEQLDRHLPEELHPLLLGPVGGPRDGGLRPPEEPFLVALRESEERGDDLDGERDGELARHVDHRAAA